MDIRKNRILHSINLDEGVGLEIGPLSTPIVSKEEANIFYLDHVDTQGLKDKYKDEPVVLEDIAQIDYVLKDSSLTKTFPKRRFDYVLASHVIEHIPDTISWLKQLNGILRPGGVVSLIIPDKRFTFDINRRVSLPAEVIGAYYDRLTGFTSAMMYDFAYECKTEVDTAAAWADPEGCRASSRRWSQAVVEGKLKDNLNPDKYVDCHCFVYTPASFVEILLAAIEHELLDFEVDYFLETQQNEIEFYVTLRKPIKVVKKKQLASLPNFATPVDKTKELQLKVEQLEADLELMKGSISWKVTKGLRATKRIAAKARGRR